MQIKNNFFLHQKAKFLDCLPFDKSFFNSTWFLGSDVAKFVAAKFKSELILNQNF